MTKKMIIPKLTIAIPTHDMMNKGFFFTRCLDSLWGQSFQDFDIVVSDNSEGDSQIKEICDFYSTGIRYLQNPIKGMAQNTNEAIRNSNGAIIKLLYMDDYLAHSTVLEKIITNWGDSNWMVLGSENNQNPRWTNDIHLGNNKLGSPSALVISNKDPLLFDENLTWLLDCDLYKRYYDKYGEPKILKGEHIAIGEGYHQMTHLLSRDIKIGEYYYLQKKYG